METCTLIHYSFGIVGCLSVMVLLLMTQWPIRLGCVFVRGDLLKMSWLFINSSLLSFFLVDPYSFFCENGSHDLSYP